MNNDNELLEFAAKAAGLLIGFSEGFPDPGRPYVWNDDHKTSRWWNPLTDDGDSLRLAVRLQFDVCQQIQTNDPATPAGCVVVAPGGHTCFEANGTDTYAATRRAIVRAAAEIGRSMA